MAIPFFLIIFPLWHYFPWQHSLQILSSPLVPPFQDPILFLFLLSSAFTNILSGQLYSWTLYHHFFTDNNKFSCPLFLSLSRESYLFPELQRHIHYAFIQQVFLKWWSSEIVLSIGNRAGNHTKARLMRLTFQ